MKEWRNAAIISIFGMPVCTGVVLFGIVFVCYLFESKPSYERLVDLQFVEISEWPQGQFSGWNQAPKLTLIAKFKPDKPTKEVAIRVVTEQKRDFFWKLWSFGGKHNGKLFADNYWHNGDIDYKFTSPHSPGDEYAIEFHFVPDLPWRDFSGEQRDLLKENDRLVNLIKKNLGLKVIDVTRYDGN